MYEPVYLFMYPFHFYLSINLFVYLSFIHELFVSVEVLNMNVPIERMPYAAHELYVFP